jgi:hypothetical protein
MCFAQAPDLGSAAGFVLFTTEGAMGNTGASQITGNIGTHVGAVTGFEPPAIVNGNIYIADDVTLQCSIDLTAAYNQLYNTAATFTDHAPAFGGGETLVPGVYSIAAAGSVAGDLTLDAEGDFNAVFIFKFGGAFTTGAVTTIHLINGALACNVFWQAEGAISMAANTSMKGTLIANNGAISLAAGGILEGRMFSTTGAVAIDAVSAILPIGCGIVILPIELFSFNGHCNKQQAVLRWSTASESDCRDYIIEKSKDGTNWQMLAKIDAAGNSSTLRSYEFTDQLPGKGISYYRLTQTNTNGTYKYGGIVIVRNCVADATENVTAYPNPSTGEFTLLYSGDRSQVHSTEIFNAQGKKVYEAIGLPAKINLSANAAGMYVIYVHLDSKTVKCMMLIVK